MQGLVKLTMNNFYGVQKRKDTNDSYYCKAEQWMTTEYDEKNLDYWKLPNGIYIVKMKKDDELDDDYDGKNTLPAHLGAFLLGNSQKIMNIFIREIKRFYNRSKYYGDTDSSYLEKKIGICWIKQIYLEKNYAKVKMVAKQGASFVDYS